MLYKLTFNTHCSYSINYHLVLDTKSRYKCANYERSPFLFTNNTYYTFFMKKPLNKFSHDKNHIHLLLEFAFNI
ncbi:transposase [Borreliella bavariensis]|uniref:transposase n=1 Tax=Borreliella bavariensis TaxID=664662 RepID=UPI001CB6CD6F